MKKKKDETKKLPEVPKTNLVSVSCTGKNGDCTHPIITRSTQAMQDARADHIAYAHKQ